MAKKWAKKTKRKVDKAKTNDKESTSSENKESKTADNKGGMTVDTLEKQKGRESAKVKPGKRLYLNAAKDALVPEGHEDAATLYCTEHKEVPRAEYESLNIAALCHLLGLGQDDSERITDSIYWLRCDGQMVMEKAEKNEFIYCLRDPDHPKDQNRRVEQIVQRLASSKRQKLKREGNVVHLKVEARI